MKLHTTTRTIKIKDVPKWWEEFYTWYKGQGFGELPVTQPFEPDWGVMFIMPEFRADIQRIKIKFRLLKDNYLSTPVGNEEKI